LGKVRERQALALLVKEYGRCIVVEANNNGKARTQRREGEEGYS